MNDFDDVQWDEIDIDEIDQDQPLEDIETKDKPSVSRQKAAKLLHKSDEEGYVDKELDRLWAPENEAEWNSLSQETKWSKIINAMENSLNYRWTKSKDRLEYEQQNLEDKVQAAETRNSPNLKFLQTKLALINAQRQALVNEMQDNIQAIDFVKAQASGIINNEQEDVYYQEHPNELRRALAKSHKYKPTTLA